MHVFNKLTKELKTKGKTMIKQIKKWSGQKNKWITVICEDEKTIDTTLCYLQDKNPDDLYYVEKLG